MNTSSLPALSHPGFELATSETPLGLSARFAGTADMHANQPLERYLNSLHEIAAARGVRHVEVDFSALEFMNSSCFKAFVSWLGQIKDLPPDARYRVAFRSNASMHWQRRSLSALRCFAVEIVSIDP